MTDEQQTAIDVLRSSNHSIATTMKNAVDAAVKRASEFINDAEDISDVLNGIKVIESAGKIVGLTPKETQTNIQINAINGFEFIAVDEADLIQIQMEESFDEDN